MSLALIFVIPWENVVEVSAIGTLSKVLGMIAAVVWGVSVLVTGQFRKPTAFHICMGLFFLWNALSVFWTMDLDSSMQRAIKYAQLGVFVFIIWDVMRTDKAVRAGLQAYVFGCYVSVASILMGWQAAGTDETRHTTEGFNPDDIGLVLALGIPFAWHLARSLSRNSAPHIVLKWINYVYVPAAFLGILLTGTRGALIASGPAFLYAFSSMRHFPLKWKLMGGALLVGLLMAAFLIVPAHLIERFGTIPESITEGKLGGRVEIWRQSIPMYLDRPIIGIGSGAFGTIHPMRRSPHSIIVSVIVELGLVGFLLLLGVAMAVALCILNCKPPNWTMWLAVALVLALGASVMNWEWRKQTWLILSLLTSHASLYAPKPSFLARPAINRNVRMPINNSPVSC
jgi:O-antigen ligase